MIAIGLDLATGGTALAGSGVIKVDKLPTKKTNVNLNGNSSIYYLSATDFRPRIARLFYCEYKLDTDSPHINMTAKILIYSWINSLNSIEH